MWGDEGVCVRGWGVCVCEGDGVCGCGVVNVYMWPNQIAKRTKSREPQIVLCLF